ncbi:hypothetical protein Sste5344_007427 [Sporothrix stenoceras]
MGRLTDELRLKSLEGLKVSEPMDDEVDAPRDGRVVGEEGDTAIESAVVEVEVEVRAEVKASAG